MSSTIYRVYAVMQPGKVLQVYNYPNLFLCAQSSVIIFCSRSCAGWAKAYWPI